MYNRKRQSWIGNSHTNPVVVTGNGLKNILKGIEAQFRRHASAVPNLIVIRFDCSTAEKQLWFRRRARVEPNSGFTDAS